MAAKCNNGQLNSHSAPDSREGKDKSGSRKKKKGSAPAYTKALHEKVLINRGYKLGSDLGEGAFAKVYKATSACKRNKTLAIKVIDTAAAPQDFREKFIPRELKVHQFLKHNNIVQLYDVFRVQTKIYVVLEFAAHGDLLDFLKLRGAVGEPEGKFMFRQLSDAMLYMHMNKIVHRDLKCENILLDSFNNVKLTDFGFARTVDNELCKTFCGSTPYCSPEIIRGTPYKGPAYDMWSMGIILFIILNGTLPFDPNDVRQMVKAQEAKRITYSPGTKEKLSKDAVRLIGNLLEPEPSKRYTINHCLKSTWLSNASYQLRETPPGDNTLREPYKANPKSKSSKSSSVSAPTASKGKDASRQPAFSKDAKKTKKNQKSSGTKLNVDGRTPSKRDARAGVRFSKDLSPKSKDSGKSGSAKSGRGTSKSKSGSKLCDRDVNVLPASFVSSSTRCIANKPKATKSNTKVSTDKFVVTKIPASLSCIKSEITYYDKNPEMKQRIKANAYI